MAGYLRLLILDDEPADVEKMLLILRNAAMDFEYRTVINQTDFIEALEIYSPQLILSSHKVPNFNSIQALELLQAKNIFIPFILVTSTISEEFAANIIKLGADDYILKTNLIRLPVAIEEALDLYKQKKEKYLAKVKLLKSEEKFRLLVSQASDAIFYINTAGYFLQVNGIAIELFGYTEAEFLCMHLNTIIIEQEQIENSLMIEKLERGNSVIFERNYIHKNGSSIAVEVNAKKLYDGNYLAIVRDIRIRKKESQLLVENESKYRSLIEQASDGIALTNGKGIFLEVNQNFCKLTGYTKEEFKNLNLTDLIPEKEIKSNPPHYKELMEGKKLIYERTIKRKDGSEFYAEINSKMASSEIFIGFMRDITARKKAEELLIKSNQRNQAFLSAIPDLIFVLNRDGIFTDFQSAPETEVLMKAEQFLGKNISELLSEELANETKKNIHQILSTGKKPHHQYQLAYPDGIHHFDARYAAINKDEVLIIVTDISPIIHTKQLLRASQKKLNAIFNSSFQFTGLLDIEGRVLEVNQTLLDYIDLTQDAIQGKFIWDVQFWHIEEDRADRVQRLKNGIQLAATGTFVRYETKIVSKKNEIDYIDFSVKPIFNSDGNVEYLLPEGRIITDKKSAEKELAQSRLDKEIALNRINDKLISVDTNWCYTFLNDASLAEHPLGRDTIIGKCIWDIHPELENTKFKQKFFDAVQTGKVIEMEDYYPPLNTWFNVKLYPATDGLTILYQDINDRKNTELKIKQINEELEQRVKERTAELQELNDLFIGREARIIELKEELAELKSRLNISN